LRQILPLSEGKESPQGCF